MNTALHAKKTRTVILINQFRSVYVMMVIGGTRVTYLHICTDTLVEVICDMLIRITQMTITHPGVMIIGFMTHCTFTAVFVVMLVNTRITPMLPHKRRMALSHASHVQTIVGHPQEAPLANVTQGTKKNPLPLAHGVSLENTKTQKLTYVTVVRVYLRPLRVVMT
jgi:hypothetical protein